MLERLASEVMAWPETTVFQVDERVLPAGDPGRNLTSLLAHLPRDAAERVLPMPVEENDLERAAASYARLLPARLDLVHLGLGQDGHTASLAPGDPVLDVTDRAVAVTSPYLGARRMTLTYPALAGALEVLWLVTGEEKSEVLARLLAGDTAIPAGRVETASQLVIADEAAAG